MASLSSITDWPTLTVALVGVLLYVVAERDRLGITKRTASADNEGKPLAPSEPYVRVLAAIYSRVLIGIVFGVALGNTYAGLVSGSFRDEGSGLFQTQLAMQWAALAVSAVALSTVFSIAYGRAYASWTSRFVGWTERLVFSFVGFGVIFLFAWFDYDRQAETYHLATVSLVNVVMSSAVFLVAGFPSTPVDWAVALVNKRSLAGR